MGDQQRFRRRWHLFRRRRRLRRRRHPRDIQEKKAAKKSTDTATLIVAGPDAIKKLEEKGGDISKTTVKEMDAIAFAPFDGQTLKGDKAAKGNMLLKLVKAQPAPCHPEPHRHMLHANHRHRSASTSNCRQPTLPLPVDCGEVGDRGRRRGPWS